MDHSSILISIALIFSSAAILATLAMFARQSLLVAYILLGVALGPWGLRWVTEAALIQQIANIGIVFLLFLLGLSMQPQKLVASLRSALWVTILSTVLFYLSGYAVAIAFGFPLLDCLVIGVCMSFSSTIIGLKLLPSSELYRQRTGELIISVLLLQDLIAIVVLLFLQSRGGAAENLALLLLALPGLIVATLLIERYVLDYLLRKFDAIQEYVFLVAVGWCLGVAVMSEMVGLSAEVGAFIAGIAMATSPAARFIARRLAPLRDFFLILFFFAVGASLNLDKLGSLWIPAVALAVFMLGIKPWVFQRLFQRAGEDPEISREVSLRLGQASEFSLLVAFLAVQHAVVSAEAGYVIQLTTIITFIGSSYIVNRILITPSTPVQHREA